MILILTDEYDPHADHVEAKLRQRNARYVRFNPAAFPTRAAISCAYSALGLTSLILSTEGRAVDLTSVTSVWYRRPLPPLPHADIVDARVRDYLADECRTVLNDAWHVMNCPVLPAWPEVVRRAELKATQLATAATLSFELPPTLITTDPSDFIAFYNEHAGNVISKLPSSALYQHTGETFNRYTQVVSPREVAHAYALQRCPVIFQAYVPKHMEIRVTVVGRNVFAAEIHSQQTNRTRHDWRRYDHYETPYRRHTLPADLAAKCLRLVDRLGLCYGAIDFVLTPDGRYVFLEINPNGQYLWIEEATGLPISDAVCDLLQASDALVAGATR